jgi:hypothetical protein
VEVKFYAFLLCYTWKLVQAASAFPLQWKIALYPLDRSLMTENNTRQYFCLGLFRMCSYFASDVNILSHNNVLKRNIDFTWNIAMSIQCVYW